MKGILGIDPVFLIPHTCCTLLLPSSSRRLAPNVYGVDDSVGYICEGLGSVTVNNSKY